MFIASTFPRRACSSAFFALALLGGCFSGEFSGDNDVVRFTSSAGEPWNRWTPRTPLAVGTRLVVDAVDVNARSPDDGAIPPDATPESDDVDGVLADRDFALNHFEATVSRAGVARVVWAGAFDDAFDVEGAEVAGGAFVDPVRGAAFAAHLFDELDDVTAVMGPDVAAVLRLPPQARLALGLQARDAAGKSLATTSDHFAVVADDLAVTSNAFLATVTAPDAVDGAGVLRLRYDGVEVHAMDVVATDPARVVRLEVAPVPGVLAAVKATAFLDDGEVLWQAPITWELDERLAAVDQGPLGNDVIGEPFDPVRTDVLVFGRTDSGEEPIDATIVAHIGDIAASVVVNIRGRGAAPAVEETPVDVVGCGCANAGSGGGVDGAGVVGMLLLLRAFGRRRRE